MKKPLVKLVRNLLKLLVVAALGVGAWYAYDHYRPVEEDVGLGALPTAVAEVRDITVSVQAAGVLQPIKIVEIKSKASGEVLRMPVEVGDLVAAGDLIAQVDTEILDQELKQVQADYDSAVVRLDIARSQYERAQSLYGQDLISENDLEASQQSFSNAEAQMLRNAAALELARERLADATVRAPAAGTIVAKSVEEGQIIASSTNNVSGGTTLVQMADLSELQIRTLVDEVDIGQVRAGLEVESRVEAFPDELFAGNVMMIEPQAVVQQSVTTFPVLSRIDNADGKLLPGMNAEVSIVVHREPGVLAVPNEAVRTPQDAATVRRMLGLIGDAGDEAAAAAARGRGDEADEGSPARRVDRGEVRTGGSAEGAGGRSVRGARGGADAGSSVAPSSRSSSVDREQARARFQNASPQERARMMSVFRESASVADLDPFGLAGRREDAVVFVTDELGRTVTKDIVVGVRDWEYTRVLVGLEPGDQVVILPSTSLLESQDRLRSWARGRSGIPGVGGGGGPPPGRGRR